MIYAVIDTNVLVSAHISKNSLSPTVKVVSHMLNGHIKPVYNDGIIAEYTEVLHRPKFKLNDFSAKIPQNCTQSSAFFDNKVFTDN